MIGRLLASAALTVALAGTAMAQMTAPPATNPPAPSSPSGSGTGAMRAPMHLNQPASKSKQTAQGASQAAPQGTPKLNAADQLNACEAKPVSERQACIAAATRM